MPIVSNPGGTGTGSVTITGPLGTRPGAQSISFVLANDQTVPVSIAGTVAVSAVSLPLPTNAAAETGGNLASAAGSLTTIAGIVSGLKAAVKASAGDIVDLATLLTRVPAALTAAGWFQVSVRGAANLATSQVTSTATAATVAIARPTRKVCSIRNGDAANAVWYGPATVTTANGFIIKAGESKDITWPGLIQIIDNGAHALLYISDEYD